MTILLMFQEWCTIDNPTHCMCSTLDIAWGRDRRIAGLQEKLYGTNMPAVGRHLV